ncbi:MAG TPA: bifunctional [glutamine synthetase] adenylyltransferase/[glutamine synthetase]-adenylyl-L-tyrosine phosphorylase [Candidatus Lumbricidophila sp.]|nr:bifunctional [glutamine synthetase] adenylyltransferase/[glutamine synthetase]-adenylyl-L-tyrosine phosphorylase [Candidatus Lumbricidophila sp.]
MDQQTLSLGLLAKAGFTDLSAAAQGLRTLAERLGCAPESLADALGHAADPDDALASLNRLAERAPGELSPLIGDPDSAARVCRVFGASRGLAEFFARHPGELDVLANAPTAPKSQTDASASLRAAVAAVPVSTADYSDVATRALRTHYRRELAAIAAWDLEADAATAVLEQVAAGLADLAGATLDAALGIARSIVGSREGEASGPGRFPAAQVDLTRLAIIAMGKCGARELNYVSDVDVIYVGESADRELLESGRAIDISTRLAIVLQRIIGEPGIEPPLWEVDPNLRPEGKAGALVRTLESHLQYYDRWAKNWEFQALLKARPIAGDRDLGERYHAALAPKVWTSAGREGFVESVQAMRERVTEHIPADQVDVQLKLGPGGLRDIEFTVQLLQLVHGASDDSIHQRGTLSALGALAEATYVGRSEASEFAADYRMLRVLEHRLQLSRLRRTHLMPRAEAELRVLARATGFGRTADEVVERWQACRRRVRGLHERLFYRPLLSAVAALPAGGAELSTDQAEARLRAIGFRDPRGALQHLASLTAGVSRRAAIQRTLLPVLVAWFAEGADPDYGLLAFRRISEALGESPWYLKLLRDSSDLARRLTRVLSGSRFAGHLLERIPEAVAWLEEAASLAPRSLESLREEVLAVVDRHEYRADDIAKVLRAVRRREVLRLAMSAILDVCTIEELGHGLSDIAEAHIDALVRAIRGPEPDGIEFGVIAMGRFGGRELGIGSDADVMYVYRIADESTNPDAAHSRALKIVSELVRLTEDARLPFELDPNLRPEGRNGVVARSLEAYRAYYARWSLTWEAQALLRARPVAGDAGLLNDFMTLADEVRYPTVFDESAAREVKRIKARVENERLPQGADPARHLKLGRGSLSDIEWYVQLLQLQHGAAVADLRTPSTLDALEAAVSAEVLTRSDASVLRAAWVFASRARSALTLWLDKSTDVLPSDRAQLEGVARILAYPPGSAGALEHDYLQATRRARAVFERGFYGIEPRRDTRGR